MRTRIQACLVHGIEPALIEINDEYNVIPETGHTMSSRHGDDEGEEVIDERVEGFVHEGAPWERRNGLKLVVDKQLGQHEEEPKGIDAIDQRIDRPRVPRAMRLIEQ